jgi:hypothetical protein
MKRITRGAAALPVVGLLLGAVAAFGLSSSPASASTNSHASNSSSIYVNRPRDAHIAHHGWTGSHLSSHSSARSTGHVVPTASKTLTRHTANTYSRPAGRTSTDSSRPTHASSWWPTGIASSRPTPDCPPTKPTRTTSPTQSDPGRPTDTTSPTQSDPGQPTDTSHPTDTPTTSHGSGHHPGEPAGRTNTAAVPPLHPSVTQSRPIVTDNAPDVVKAPTSPTLNRAPSAESGLTVSDATSSSGSSDGLSASTSTSQPGQADGSDGSDKPFDDALASTGSPLGLSDNLLLATMVAVFALLVVVLVSASGHRGGWRQH